MTEKDKARQNLGEKITRISDMLHYMKLPDLDEEYQKKHDKAIERKIATEDEYRIVLEQKQILNEYVNKFTAIAKRREKSKWDKIKEHDAKVKAKLEFLELYTK